ncbi:MAG: hypothetical protein ACRC1K_07635, partial [Planctomycetia bacterium]
MNPVRVPSTEGVEPAAATSVDRAVDVERLVVALEPAALFLEPRLVRRIFRELFAPALFGLRLPRDGQLAVPSAELLKIVDRDEIGLTPDAPVPAVFLVFTRPDAASSAERDRSTLVADWRRRLFHNRLHAALEFNLDGSADDRWSPAAVRRRVLQIGAVEFDEARHVLRQENLLLPPADDREVLVEFLVFWNELRYFSP